MLRKATVVPLGPDINPINAGLFIALGTSNEIKYRTWIRWVEYASTASSLWGSNRR